MAKTHPWTDALAGGFAGALALTALHETARRLIPDAPRMDVLGRRGIARGLEMAGVEPPPRDRLQSAALIGDLASNGLAYALVGLGPLESALARGAAIGALCGVGALVMPPVMGLGPSPSRLKPRTRAMTFAWYFAGGLVAAEVYRRLRSARS
jgi:hypothetical protein